MTNIKSNSVFRFWPSLCMFNHIICSCSSTDCAKLLLLLLLLLFYIPKIIIIFLYISIPNINEFLQKKYLISTDFILVLLL